MSKIVESATLYYREGSSDKVYHIEVVDDGAGSFSVPFAYGRRGSTLQKGFKTQKTYLTDARVQMGKVVREKLKKGYSYGPSMNGVTGANSEASAESAWDEYLKAKSGDLPSEPVETISESIQDDNDSGLNPMLLNNIEDPEEYLDSDEWLLQEKHDGRRLIVRKEGGTIVGINSSGKCIPLSADLNKIFEDLKEDVILDGESIGDKFFVFDCLKFGSSINAETDFKSRAIMAKDIVCKKIKSDDVIFVTYYETKEDKIAAFNRIRDLDGEGVVFKRAYGHYKAGRPASGGCALKFKFYQTVTAQVVKQNGAKRSVFLALTDDGDGTEAKKLTDVGKVTIPANYDIPKAGQLCEIRYLYAYRGGCLYQPIYQGVREDRYAPDKLRTLKFKPVPTDDEPEEEIA